MKSEASPATVQEAIEQIKANHRILTVGNQTKPGLVPSVNDCLLLKMTSIQGIIEYEPTEFTITANAGTKICEIESELRKNGQFLPFDPPMMNEGATLAGTVASGLNGASSLRYGGMRDFVLGVRFIDGRGQLIFSGGKVVKNAAGFDLPKFFVGSCGRFGAITELTLKVFPRPLRHQTLIFEDSLSNHVAAIQRLNRTPIELDGIDLHENSMWIRIGGSDLANAKSKERIESVVNRDVAKVLEDAGDQDLDSGFWSDVNHFRWADNSCSLIKVPCCIDQVESIAEMGSSEISIHFSLGGQVSNIACPPGECGELLTEFQKRGLTGQVILDPSGNNHPIPTTDFSRRIKAALDPDNRFSV